MPMTYQAILEHGGLRITQPRLLVLRALSKIGKPSSHKEIFEYLRNNKSTIHLVTVYRILETFEECGIVHKHPSSGGYSTCMLHGKGGHHVLLSCDACDSVHEQSDAELCKQENRIAKQVGFIPKHHVSEIIGLCPSCQ